MDISDSLSTDNSELDETMGSILSTSNENETQNAETDPPVNIITEEPSLISQNIEVNELQNTTESAHLPDTTLDNVETYTDTLSEQDINLIIMGKPTTSDDVQEIISSSVKNNLSQDPITSAIEEHEELWLGDNTRQLVKVDTDEDFEVIVKSLETAIVETERYDIDTVISSNDEPVMSSVASSSGNSLGISIIEVDNHSLLEDIPSNLLTSAVPPFPLQGLQVDERVEISARILALQVESSVTHHRSLSNYDEFATIPEPKVDSFDEQTSSLFEVMEPEIDIPIDNKPSLLELQEATMPTDISQEFHQDIEKQEDTILCNSAITVEINIKADELDEICEASVDSEFAEKRLIDEEIESNTHNTNEDCSKEIEESFKKENEKLELVEKLMENKNEITTEIVTKMDTSENETKSDHETPDSEDIVMSMQISQLENIFDTNSGINNIKETITTSIQLQNKTATIDDGKYVTDILIDPELPLKNTSKIDEETENPSNVAINTENQLEPELNVGVKVDTESSEKLDYEHKIDANKNEESILQENIIPQLQIDKECSFKISESTENEKIVTEADVVQEELDYISEIEKNKIDIECKNTSPKEDINKPVQTIDLKMSIEREKSTETCIKSKKDEIDESLLTLAKELQEKIVPPEKTQTETLPLKDTNTCSTMSLKHSLNSDEKEQSPPKKIKLVREKFQIKSVHTKSQQLQKNIETFIESEKKTINQEVIISCETKSDFISQEKATEIDLETVLISANKPVAVIESKETIQQILEKLEDPVDKSISENKSPVKAQKLKLQRNYKLPQKSLKQKQTIKKIEESVSKPSEKIIEEELKITNIFQDKLIQISSIEETEKIPQSSLSKPKDTKIAVVSIKSNEPAVITKNDTKYEDQTKSVEPVKEIEINLPVETVSSFGLTEIIQEISSTEQEKNELIEVKIMEINPIESQINLEKLEETNTVDTSIDLEDFTERKSEIENKVLDNQISQIEQNADFTHTLFNMETESIETKIEESNLNRNEISIEETEKVQITNIDNESTDIKNQQPDLVESEVEETEDVQITNIAKETTDINNKRPDLVESEVKGTVEVQITNIAKETTDIKNQRPDLVESEVKETDEVQITNIAKKSTDIKNQRPDLVESEVEKTEEVQITNIAKESTDIKNQQPDLVESEVAETEEVQIINIGNKLMDTKKTKPDLVEIEVKQKKDVSCLIENQNIPQEDSPTSVVESSQCIEEMSIMKTKENSSVSEVEIISLEQKTTTTEKIDILEKVFVENVDKLLKIEACSEIIKKPEIAEEDEQISPSNIDSILGNITETEMESTPIITKTENIIDRKNIEENNEIEKNFDTPNNEKKTRKNEDIGDTTHVESKTETVNIDNTYKSEEISETENIVNTYKSRNLSETKNIVNTNKLKETRNKYEAVDIKFETDRMKPEPKYDKSLTIDTQYPLLSSRLQERLAPKSRKFTQEVKVTPVTLPRVSQESVSKRIQEQLIGNKTLAENITISKQDVLPTSTAELSKTEATAFLAKNPEITLTRGIASSSQDHLATMESATKIKIIKRKLDTSEPIAKRSVTKPLSVQIDDLELQSAIIERSHSSGQREQESIPKIVIKSIPKPEGRASPKITIKPIKPPEEISHKSRASEESSHSPKITIKPIVKTDPLKITITKQKADDTHSILKIYHPEDTHDHHIPKLTIKPIPKSDEMQHSPRITIKPVKPSPSTSSMSPKITVKPIPSPSEQVEIIHSPKITVKPVVNPEESYPKVTIKPVLRPEESHKVSQLSPRQIKLKAMTFESSSGVTVEPICGTGNILSAQKLDSESQTSPLKISVKPFAKMEESLSPKLTIKPITKTCEIVQSEAGTSNPLKLTIKPILKPEETSYQSPKITIKPIVKPDEINQQLGEELDKPERIILKIQKTSLPSPKERLKDTKKEPEIKIEAIPHDPEKSQRLDKIKLKLTKEGSHAQIIPSISSISTDVSFSLKRSLGISDSGVLEKRSKTEFPGTEILHTSDISINIVEPNAKPCLKTISEEVTIMKIDKVASGSRAPTTEQQISQSKFKEMLMKIQQKPDITCTPHIEAEPDYSSSSDDVKIVEIVESDPLKDPLSLNDESNSQDIMIVNEVINTNPFQNIQIISAKSPVETNLQTPKKRGRPRKNPLEVKPEIKGEDCVEVRPKRTCRAPPGRTPFAVKERKPRGAGRGRGGSRGRGASKSPQKSPKEIKTPRGKALKEAKALAKIEAARLAQEVVIDEITIEDSTNDTPAATPVPPAEDSPKKPEVKESEPSPQMVEPEIKISPISEELPKQPPPSAVYEEETRMSAENNSRAQTPARQVFTVPLVEGPEESQSSVQSTATTESSKTKKGRLEVCDPDSAVTTVDQIVEYSWANGGPYMLQEQIAQYLGVKSFKRKYPGLTRRPVEMQERDYIREKGLVSESMCDMGLTAVPSSEILDIMYSDFQEKYEEYRKCLRDKQAKEISNKQKAVSLATSQEKNKIDFKERAIRSAANWNVNFNKARKETRKCCMDLQTFTINYPAGKMKVPHKNPVGHYPVALVPGQYTDFYKSYTTNDLHYLPLNTVRYGPVLPNQHCDAGQSDGSQSDSDSSSGSDSDSSDDSMSTEEEAPSTIVCKPASVQLTQLITTPKSKVH